jgi:hypothetical protein
MTFSANLNASVAGPSAWTVHYFLSQDMAIKQIIAGDRENWWLVPNQLSLLPTVGPTASRASSEGE